MPESITYNMDCVEFYSNYVAYIDGKIYSVRSKRFLKPLRGKDYDFVMIGRTTILIHRIIATSFIPNPDRKPCVNHIDGYKRNNSAENLEWCTYSENLIHAYRTGLNKSERAVVRTDQNGNETVYRSARAAEIDGYSNQLIAKCCKGKRNFHGGCKWRYAD